MKRPRLRLLVALVGALTVSLVGTSSYAAYRTAMGPEQCCKSLCHHSHRSNGGEAERCCRTHLTVLPAAFSKASPQDAVAPAHVVGSALIAPAVPLVAFGHAPAAVAGRAPPPQSLFAQHTALLR